MSPRKAKPKRKPRVTAKPQPERRQVVPVHDPEIAITVENPPGKPRVMERIAAKTGSKLYRYLETVSFTYALFNLGALMTVEVLHRMGYRFGNADPDHGFPYGILIGSVILIAPKLIGRAFAGRALVAIAGRGGDGGFGVTAEQPAGKGGE